MSERHSSSPDKLIRISGDVHKGLSGLTLHPKYQRGWPTCCGDEECHREQTLRVVAPDSMLGAALREQGVNGQAVVLSAAAERIATNRLLMLRRAAASKSGGRGRVWVGLLNGVVQNRGEHN